MAGPSARLDLRVALPIVVLGVVVLVIIFVELCGREDLAPLVQDLPDGDQPLATLGPTFTPGPSPTPGPVPPTATKEILVGGSARDTIRVQDLATLQEVLEQYQQENGNYPTTEGSIQSLCAYTEVDVGCELQEVLSPLPQDPLGASTENGYWYSSNGDTYTLFAQREADAFPACTQHPEFLVRFESILCREGP